MVLSDYDIIKRVNSEEIGIDPFKRDNVEPASIDLRLGHDFKLVHSAENGCAKLSEDDKDQISHAKLPSPLVVKPGDLVLVTTLERVELPNDLAAQVIGRSSLGRLGVSVHQTAGYIDPGFEGEITLELSNNGPVPVEIEPELRICQIVFKELSSPAMDPYGHEGSQYQDQSGATRSGMDFE